MVRCGALSAPPSKRFALPKLLLVTVVACAPGVSTTDGGSTDSGSPDAAVADAGPSDGGAFCLGDGGDPQACQDCLVTCPSDGVCFQQPDAGYECEA